MYEDVYMQMVQPGGAWCISLQDTSQTLSVSTPHSVKPRQIWTLSWATTKSTPDIRAQKEIDFDQTCLKVAFREFVDYW